MKSDSYLILLFLLFSSFFLAGQESNLNEIGLKDLEVPNSPAFILLDVSPTLIAHPTSSKAFAATVLNSVNENNGIPQNYAVEFTPFWYFRHPNLTSYNYWGIDAARNRNRGFSQVRLASVSFAYIKSNLSDSLTSDATNNIAIGFRSTIFRIIDKKNRTDLIEANNNLVKKLSELNNQLSNFNPFDEDYKKKVQEFIDQMSSDKGLLEAEKAIQEILKRRPLFAIDGATAVNWSFNGNNFNTNQLSLFGAWLTMNYSKVLNPKSDNVKNYASILVVTRYTYDNSIDGNPLANDSYVSLLDVGTRILFEFRQLSFSYEYIFRSVPGQSINTFRSTGMALYKISDKIYILASFGKNFGDKDNLIAQFGLNLGLGTGNEKVTATND